MLVCGSLLAQNTSGATGRLDCNVLIGGTTMRLNSQVLVATGSSTTVAVSAAKTLDPWTYDVSVTCSVASVGLTAGTRTSTWWRCRSTRVADLEPDPPGRWVGLGQGCPDVLADRQR